jgi:hypothetical protein
VGGDARVAGGNITISSPIGGDLLIAGGNISLTEKSSVSGDLVIGGGNVILNAPVMGRLKAGVGNLTINSKIEGDVEIYSSGRGKGEGNVVFGPKAEVLGKIFHKGSKQAVIQEGAKVSAIDFTLHTGRKAMAALAGFLTAAVLIKLIAWLWVWLVWR